jgi:RDD family
MTTSDRLEAAGEPPAVAAHHIRDGEGEVGEALSAAAVQRLLIGYGVALDTAAGLPALVRIATRPRPRSIFDALRFLPRPTIGTSTMVTHHVRRSTAALVRRYDRMAATRGLTDDEKHANELVKTFNASLPEPRWKLIIAVGLIAVFIVTRIITGPVSTAVTNALKSIVNRQINADAVRTLNDAVFRSGSAVPTAGSFMDLFAQFGKAGPAELATLASTIAIAGYLVLRPLSSAFRFKRIIFNLAASGDINLDRTTTAWNIPRSAGLYQSEQAVFAGLGARAPREFDFDLWISVVPAGVLLWVLWPGNIIAQGTSGTIWVLHVAVAATLAGARIAWLVQTGRARRRAMSPIDPPAGFRLSGANGVVEARSVLETASLGFASFLFLWALPINANFVVPSPVWVRLVHERRELERALNPSVGIWRRLPRADVWPALGSAILLWVVPPLPLAIHLTHLARMQPPGVGSARRTRAWLVPLAAVVTVLVALAQIHVISMAWLAVSHIAAFAMFIAAFAAIQHEHNALAAHVGEPLPFDDPEPAGALPREAYTPWIRRVLAALIDMMPILILGIIAVGALALPAPGCETEYWHCQLAIAGSLTGFVLLFPLMLAALIMVPAYAIWNWGHRQGRTGSSVGKSVLRFRVVSEKTGQPIGSWLSIVRLFLHAVDLLPLCIGFLLPLCDAKRRTLADEIMLTVCLPIPTAGISETRGPQAISGGWETSRRGIATADRPGV